MFHTKYVSILNKSIVIIKILIGNAKQFIFDLINNGKN